MKSISFLFDNKCYKGLLIPDKQFYGGYKVSSGNMTISYELIKNQIIEIKMKLREQINTDFMTAFKAKNTVAKNLLSVVRGEIQTTEKNTGKELSDEEVLAILTKTTKSLKEMVANGSEQAKIELEIIESYLPKQMSKEEVAAKVAEVINSGATNIGAIMKEFATLPADKKMVSEVARELLK